MSFLLQATATIDDFARLSDGLKWLESEVGHVDGLIVMRVFRQADAPDRFTILEEWEDTAAFQRSFETYNLDQRAEFLARLGLTAESFERTFWESTDIAPLLHTG